MLLQKVILCIILTSYINYAETSIKLYNSSSLPIQHQALMRDMQGKGNTGFADTLQSDKVSVLVEVKNKDKDALAKALRLDQKDMKEQKFIELIISYKEAQDLVHADKDGKILFLRDFTGDLLDANSKLRRSISTNKTTNNIEFVSIFEDTTDLDQYTRLKEKVAASDIIATLDSKGLQAYIDNITGENSANSDSTGSISYGVALLRSKLNSDHLAHAIQVQNGQHQKDKDIEKLYFVATKQDSLALQTKIADAAREYSWNAGRQFMQVIKFNASKSEFFKYYEKFIDAYYQSVLAKKNLLNASIKYLRELKNNSQATKESQNEFKKKVLRMLMQFILYCTDYQVVMPNIATLKLQYSYDDLNQDISDLILLIMNSEKEFIAFPFKTTDFDYVTINDFPENFDTEFMKYHVLFKDIIKDPKRKSEDLIQLWRLCSDFIKILPTPASGISTDDNRKFDEILDRIMRQLDTIFKRMEKNQEKYNSKGKGKGKGKGTGKGGKAAGKGDTAFAPRASASLGSDKGGKGGKGKGKGDTASWGDGRGKGGGASASWGDDAASRGRVGALNHTPLLASGRDDTLVGADHSQFDAESLQLGLDNSKSPFYTYFKQIHSSYDKIKSTADVILTKIEQGRGSYEDYKKDFIKACRESVDFTRDMLNKIDSLFYEDGYQEDQYYKYHEKHYFAALFEYTKNINIYLYATKVNNANAVKFLKKLKEIGLQFMHARAHKDFNSQKLIRDFIMINRHIRRADIDAIFHYNVLKFLLHLNNTVVSFLHTQQDEKSIEQFAKLKQLAQCVNFPTDELKYKKDDNIRKYDHNHTLRTWVKALNWSNSLYDNFDQKSDRYSASLGNGHGKGGFDALASRGPVGALNHVPLLASDRDSDVVNDDSDSSHKDSASMDGINSIKNYLSRTWRNFKGFFDNEGWKFYRASDSWDDGGDSIHRYPAQDIHRPPSSTPAFHRDVISRDHHASDFRDGANLTEDDYLTIVRGTKYFQQSEIDHAGIKIITNNIKLFCSIYRVIKIEEAQEILNKIIGAKWLYPLSDSNIHEQILRLDSKEFDSMTEYFVYESMTVDQMLHFYQLNDKVLSYVSSRYKFDLNIARNINKLENLIERRLVYNKESLENPVNIEIRYKATDSLKKYIEKEYQDNISFYDLDKNKQKQISILEQLAICILRKTDIIFYKYKYSKTLETYTEIYKLYKKSIEELRKYQNKGLVLVSGCDIEYSIKHRILWLGKFETMMKALSNSKHCRIKKI